MKALQTFLVVLLITLTFVPSVSAQICQDLPAGAIAWWPFDESSGTNVEDIVGNNPGVHVNGPVCVSSYQSGHE